MTLGPRRVVNGLDADGKSTFIIDDRREITLPGAQFVWREKTSPADNNHNEDTGAGPFDPTCIHDRDGSSFAIFHFKPEDGLMGPGMHTTDTIDYIVVIKGRLEFHSDTGIVELGVGDVVVDRGVSHGWRAVGDEPAMTAVVMLPAHPVGSGATI